MECLGTRWRYIENKFINAKGEIVEQKRIRMLKSKSCNNKCQPSHNTCHSDFVHEMINDHFSDADELPSLPQGLRSGDELVLRFSFDGEEIEDLWFVKVEA